MADGGGRSRTVDVPFRLRIFNTAHLRLNTFGDTGTRTDYILYVECYLFDVPAYIWHSPGELRVMKIRPFCIRKDYSLTFYNTFYNVYPAWSVASCQIRTLGTSTSFWCYHKQKWSHSLHSYFYFTSIFQGHSENAMFHFFHKLESNIQYCALASKYVRIYRYANKLHFASGLLFIWRARTFMAFWRRIASYEDPTILYWKRLLINVLQYVLQCLAGKRAVLKSI